MKNARKMFLTITVILVLTPSATFAQCEAKCLVGASASASGDLLALFWSPPSVNLKNLAVDNVSRIVEQRVVGPVTRWQVPYGPFTVEHLAGVSPSGDLLVFFWSTAPGAKWQVVNVSAITGGHQVVGPVTNWQTQDGPFTVEHLAGVSPSGDLLVFFWSPQADWQVINVSRDARNAGRVVPEIVGPVTSWQIKRRNFLFKSTTIENLAGVSPSGDLLVFFRTPLAAWQVVNVSRITRKQVVGPVTNWLNDSDELVATGLDDNGLWVFFNLGFGRRSNPGWGYCNFAVTSCTNLIFASGR